MSPFLISLMVSVDVKHHVYLLTFTPLDLVLERPAVILVSDLFVTGCSEQTLSMTQWTNLTQKHTWFKIKKTSSHSCFRFLFVTGCSQQRLSMTQCNKPDAKAHYFDSVKIKNTGVGWGLKSALKWLLVFWPTTAGWGSRQRLRSPRPSPEDEADVSAGEKWPAVCENTPRSLSPRRSPGGHLLPRHLPPDQCL